MLTGVHLPGMSVGSMVHCTLTGYACVLIGYECDEYGCLYTYRCYVPYMIVETSQYAMGRIYYAICIVLHYRHLLYVFVERDG